MPEALDLKNAVENILNSYETKIENIGSLFESTHLFLNEFQEPLLEAKRIREEIHCQLREALSQNEHLRHKDFDRMIQGILSSQAEKENQIRNLLNNYLAEQKEMIVVLKENFSKIRDALTCGQAQVAKESQAAINQMLTQQDKRKQEITHQLKEFQREQKKLQERLLELLAKGRELRIKDLKTMLKEFDASRRARLARQEERKIEVQKRRQDIHSMLGEFKRKRKEFASLKGRQKANPSVRNLAKSDKPDIFNGIHIDGAKQGQNNKNNHKI